MRVSDKTEGKGCSICKNEKVGEMFKKQVFQFTKNGEFVRTFPSVTEASKAVGVSISAIANVCKGRTKSSAGYIWSYYEQFQE